MNPTSNCSAFAATITLLTLGAQTAEAQQGLRLSTDNLSFLEEPLAYEVGGFTVLLNALFDLSATRNLDTDTDKGRLAAIGQISAEKQLKNALTVGATYRGEENDGYDDQFAAYVRGVWGRVSVGDVAENTEIATERMDGVGNADLTLDNFYGLLDGDAIAYSGRFSAYTLNGSFDEDSNIDLGVTFERPIGNKDYRFTSRLIQSEYTAQSGEVLDTTGFVITAELIYGSLLSDLSLGYEVLDNNSYDFERNSSPRDYPTNAINGVFLSRVNWVISKGSRRAHGLSAPGMT